MAGKGSHEEEASIEKSSDKGVTIDDATEKMESMSLEEAKAYAEGDTRSGIKKYLDAREEEESEEEESEEDDEE